MRKINQRNIRIRKQQTFLINAQSSFSKNASRFITLKVIFEKFFSNIFSQTFSLGFSVVTPVCRSSHSRCSIKKVLLEVSQNWQENTCARVSFLITLQAWDFIIKKRLYHRCFPVNFVKFRRTPFLQNTSGLLVLYLWNL